MALVLPTELTYNQLQTKAFFSMFKAWPIEPANNGGQYAPGEVIRVFLTALTDGVMDPYRSHIEITVQCDANSLPVGSLQIDNSAQSLIQQLVITSKNREVERILEYGVLAAYLSDIGMSELHAEGREQEGFGYNNIDNFTSMTNSPQPSSYSTIFLGSDLDNADSQGIGRNSSVFPTIPNKNTAFSAYGSQSAGISVLSGVFKGHLSWANAAWLGPTINEVWWWYIANEISTQSCSDTVDVASFVKYGYINNVRAEYLTALTSNDFCDSTTSLSKCEVTLDLNQGLANYPPKFTNSTIYNLRVPPSLNIYNAYRDLNGKIQTYNRSITNTTGIQGFGSLISPNFAKGVREPFISPTVPQCQMQNGRILPTKIPVSSRTFKMPLVSSVLGILIPENQFILLPLRTLNDSYLELTLDQHAFFTSGYNDVSEFDNVGMGLMQKRAFKVTRVVYNLHTYQFYSPQMDEYLKININSGIAINTHFWQMANQYSIENSQSITNAWPIACNEEALNDVLVLFYSNDYQKLSFCRKHFRLSNNITKYQLRINMEYFPTQPLSGNGGNPIQLDQTGDNGVFLDQIQFSTGYKFSNVYPSPRINAYNFAINERCYDPYNVNSMYDAEMIGNKDFSWYSGSVNYDTALGMANIHENRYVGKAAYLYSFQPYAHSQEFVSGIDCRKTNQFDVIFNANPDGFYPRSQTMFIYTKSSNIMEYSKDGIVNINK